MRIEETFTPVTVNTFGEVFEAELRHVHLALRIRPYGVRCLPAGKGIVYHTHVYDLSSGSMCFVHFQRDLGSIKAALVLDSGERLDSLGDYLVWSSTCTDSELVAHTGRVLLALRDCRWLFDIKRVTGRFYGWDSPRLVWDSAWSVLKDLDTEEVAVSHTGKFVIVCAAGTLSHYQWDIEVALRPLDTALNLDPSAYVVTSPDEMGKMLCELRLASKVFKALKEL